jgi:hypothetical protein
MPCPSHPLWIDHCNYTWRRVQVMKLLIMQFSPTSQHFMCLRSNILRNTLFSNTPTLCSFLNARDNVSYWYRSTGKIIVLYILICAFLDSEREDKIFWNNGSKHCPNSSPLNFLLNQVLICSYHSQIF